MGVPVNYEKVIAELVQKNVDKMKDKAVGFVKDNYKKFTINFDFAFRTYLKNTYEKYSKVKTLLYKTEPKPLYSFFECCTLKLGKKTIDANDINHVLDLSRFAIIQGTGGIGKSTLLKHFFLNALEKKELIPLFFELKNLEMSGTDLLHTLYNTLNRLGFGLEFEYFEYALENGVFLIMLDGYDELTDEQSKSFTKDLDDFCDRYPDNYFIMTSRPANDFIHLQRFTVLEACPFTKQQAINLIEKIDYDPEVKERFIRELKERLYESHTSFASIPLLLTMMFLTYDDYAEIPEKIYVFYSNAFETMYQKHDATKGTYQRVMKSGLSYDEFKMTFAKFCYITYMKQMLDFSWSELYDYVKKCNTSSKFNAEGFIRDLKDNLCVIILEGTKYRFVHRSFQEYFTAFYLKEIDDEMQSKLVLKMIDRDEYRGSNSMLEMLLEMSQERFEKNIIIPILTQLEKHRCQTDKYQIYFQILANRVGFRKRQQRPTLVGIDIENPLASILFIVRKYKDKHKNKKIDKLILDYMKERNLDFNNRIDFSYYEIEADKDLLNIVENSWIADNARFFATCVEMLEEKHKKSFDVFEELIDSE